MSFFPQTQVLKDLSNDVPLVNEAHAAHYAGAFGADNWTDLGANPFRAE
jgi:hypothetical protein